MQIIQRQLTINERSAIGFALLRDAERVRSDQVMLLHPHKENNDEEARLTEETRALVEKLALRIAGLENLANFIARNEVIVHCSITIPEQL